MCQMFTRLYDITETCLSGLTLDPLLVAGVCVLSEPLKQTQQQLNELLIKSLFHIFTPTNIRLFTSTFSLNLPKKRVPSSPTSVSGVCAERGHDVSFPSQWVQAAAEEEPFYLHE